MKIIGHLAGGLGNQLFQYAMGRRINIDNSESSYSLNFEDHYKFAKRNYSLDNFRIKASKASKKDIALIGPERRLKRKLKHFLKLPIEKNVVREKKQFEFDPSIINVKTDCYFIGFWQSYKYFENIRQDLLNEFWPLMLRDAFSTLCNEIQGDLRSLGIHIRRSDYLNKAQFFTPLGFSYYRRAIDSIDREFGPSNIYIFTDDPIWAKSIFVRDLNYSNKIRIISDSELFDYEELCLMSLCRNSIIANSSFSWWAAWLNQSPNKRIVAPRQWNGRDEEIKLCDLIPSEWVLI